MMMINEEDKLESNKPEAIATYWKNQIKKEKRLHKDFRDLAEKAQEFYDKEMTYTIMFPTVQIMSASLYSATPAPEVLRRQKNGDKSQKDAAQILVRSLDYCLDSHDFDSNIRSGLLDFLVAGMGQARVVYKPEFGKAMGAMGEEIETITAQNLEVEHYSWKNFGWEPSKSWADCGWIYYEHRKSKKEVMKEYGVEASEDDSTEDDAAVKIQEVYHKASRTIIAICDQFDVPLEVRSDDLGLSGFYPSPKPMMTNILTDKLIPAADFKYYEKQAKDLNANSVKIAKLNKSIKAIGFYDAYFAELGKIKTANNGDLIPVDGLKEKLEGADLDSIIAEMPTEQRLRVLDSLRAEKKELKQEVYELLGIADIMRGETNSQEGVETQKLKSEFGAVRIREKQGVVDTFCRDLLRIKAEIIAEHFEPQVLTKMTGIEVTPEVEAILRSDMLRNMSIKIETDSTNAGESIRKQQGRTEALDGITNYLTGILPAMQGGVMSPELGQELMLMAVRSYDIGSTSNLEDIIAQMGEEGSPEQAVMQLQQELQQMSEQNAMMQQELERRSQVDVAKDQSVAQLNDARTQKTLSEIPGEQANTELTYTEIAGKKVEQAGNIAANMQGREVNLVGIE